MIGRLLCRLGGHRWRVRYHEDSAVAIGLVCARCRVRWHCSHDGQTWWRTYEDMEE